MGARSSICANERFEQMISHLHRFVRSVSPNDLRNHLSQSDIPMPANLNWGAPAEEFSHRFLKAVDELPDQKLIQLQADIDRISGMTDEVGQAALLALSEWRERIGAIDSPYQRAHWLYVQSRDAFRQAEEIRYADENQNAQRLWDGFVGPRLLELRNEQQIIDQFKEAVRGV